MMQIETQFGQLRLHGMNRSWKALLETRRQSELSLEEGLEILLQAEVQDRENRRFDRLQKNARFRYQASIEEIRYDASRGIDKALITRLATGEYLDKGESVLITGATGCGKSFIASALGHQACTQGYKVAYFNTQKLLMKTKMARVEGTIFKLFENISKATLLIIDDFGLTHLEQQQRLDLMEMIEDRHAKSSTIIASQLPVSSWFDVIGEETIADAILDRLVHTSHRLELKGESLRKTL
jgi:DNA replication protein DnaC